MVSYLTSVKLTGKLAVMAPPKRSVWLKATVMIYEYFFYLECWSQRLQARGRLVEDESKSKIFSQCYGTSIIIPRYIP